MRIVVGVTYGSAEVCTKGVDGGGAVSNLTTAEASFSGNGGKQGRHDGQDDDLATKKNHEHFVLQRRGWEYTYRAREHVVKDKM